MGMGLDSRGVLISCRRETLPGTRSARVLLHDGHVERTRVVPRFRTFAKPAHVDGADSMARHTIGVGHGSACAGPGGAKGQAGDGDS
jgi:hypothetical protein